ncbi:hypothetical protein, partial [Bradyrhizobium ottawaense]|uniref:hypothetical protein n=1 Tax=Bradyrhizobium ottawaense TaxID=931866 RepID=UPI0030C68B4A
PLIEGSPIVTSPAAISSGRFPMAPLSAELGDIVITNSSLVPNDTKDIGEPNEAESLMRGRIAGAMVR